jgi:hypothetical protein
LHQALALRGVLPVGESDFLHDVANVRNDALDEMCVFIVFASLNKKKGAEESSRPIPHSPNNRSTRSQINRFPGFLKYSG